MPTERAYMCAKGKKWKVITVSDRPIFGDEYAEDITGSSIHLPIVVAIPHPERSEQRNRQLFLLSARQMNSSLRAKGEELYILGLPGLVTEFKALYISSSG